MNNISRDTVRPGRQERVRLHRVRWRLGSAERELGDDRRVVRVDEVRVPRVGDAARRDEARARRVEAAGTPLAAGGPVRRKNMIARQRVARVRPVRRPEVGRAAGAAVEGLRRRGGRDVRPTPFLQPPARGRRRDDASLTVLCGDFNEDASSPACRGLEARGWTNCAAAAATQALDGGTGGTTFLGTTHRAHTGDALSCDHIFATDRSAGGQRSSGCFDAAGARLVAARRVADAWDPDFVDSDHTPVVAEFSFRETKAAPADATADPFLPPWPDCIA